MGKELFFVDIDKYFKVFGVYLYFWGLELGDKIVFMMFNFLQYFIVFFGVFWVGLIVVNINLFYIFREMWYQFMDLGVKVIVIVENFVFNLEKIIGDINIFMVIMISIGEMLGFFKKYIVNFVVCNIKKMVLAFNILNIVSFLDVLK